MSNKARLLRVDTGVWNSADFEPEAPDTWLALRQTAAPKAALVRERPGSNCFWNLPGNLANGSANGVNYIGDPRPDTNSVRTVAHPETIRSASSADCFPVPFSGFGVMTVLRRADARIAADRLCALKPSVLNAPIAEKRHT